MDANNQKQDKGIQNSKPEAIPQKGRGKQNKMPRKKKKKHNSALAAAAMGRSAVNKVGARSYKDTDFMNTGTNLSYREEE